ncbi:MAG: hypothetical protein LBU69_03140, partial [Deltaproteobacteria bacterium]|nr:hypothetical protein [Deltaproteobacteria bacterium]
MRRLKKYLVALVLPLAGAALAIALAPLAPEGKRLLSPLGQFFGPREAWAQEESTPKQETDPEAPLAQGDGSVTEIPLELDKPSPGQGEGEGVGEDLAGGGLGVEAPEAATLPLLAPPGGEPTLVMAVPST